MDISAGLTSEFDRITRTSCQTGDPHLRLLLQRVARCTRQQLERADSISGDFFHRVAQCQLRLRGTGSAAYRLDALFDCCQYLFFAGLGRDALPYVNYGFGLSTRAARKIDQRRFLNLRGILQSESGNAAAAVESYAGAMEIARELGDNRGEYSALVNLSGAFLGSGLYLEALACAQHALLVPFICDKTVPDKRGALTNVALALHFLGDQDNAWAWAVRAVEDAGLPEDLIGAMSRVVREQNLVMILVRRGELAEARARCEVMNSLVCRFESRRMKAIASIAFGLVEVNCGDPNRGLSLIDEAVSAVISESSPIYCDALVVRALALSDLERPEEALETIRRLMTYLGDLRASDALHALDACRVPGLNSRQTLLPDYREHKRTEAELRVRVAERELSRSRQEMLERMAVAADIREDISGEHGYRVGRLAALLAKEIGWDRDAYDALDIAARLHDIGKIGIPEKILLDEKTLKEAEKHFIAFHTAIGAEILSKSDIPQVRIAEEIARCHHEWWDGTGYPRGLKGMAIPKSARVVALADVFDAMTHGRPYAQAMPIEAALDQIATLRGRQFDPELTDHFLALVRRLAAGNEDLDAYLGKAARNSPFLKARARIKEMLAQGRESTALSASPPSPGTPLN